MKGILTLAAAALGAWLFLRRRDRAARVVVGWEDGSELELRAGAPERERLVGLAGSTLR